MSDVDYLVVEAAIRRLHACYADAVWRKDFDAFGDCFTEDAEWRAGGKVNRGRADIVAQLKRLMPHYNRVFMTFRSPILEVGDDGKTATSRTYVTEQSSYANGTGATSIGIYFEHHVKQADRWRFKWRLFQLHYFGPADLTTKPFTDNPDFGPPPQMPPLDAITYDYTGLGTGKKHVPA